MADCPIPSPVTYLPSARRPVTEAHQCHPVVANGTSGRSSAWDPCPQVPQGHPRVAKGASGRSSARPPLPTGTSEQSPCDERPADRSKNGNVPMRLPVFGTATLPTGISEPSLRGHCELVYRIVAELGFVKFTWHEPLLIIK